MVSASFVAAALSALPLTFAHYHGGKNATATHTAAPSATAASSPSVQTVAVGQNGLTFTPDTIHANVGDEIVFEFYPKNHSVVQADFKNPCNPSDGAIYSGFVPTTAGPANTTFTITVTDAKPIWLYCSQNKPKPHCASGMVAVINPPASGPNTLDAFRSLAAKTNESTSPSGGPSGGKVCQLFPPSSSSASSSTSSSTSSTYSASSPPYPTGSSTLVPSSTGGFFPTNTAIPPPVGTQTGTASGTETSAPAQFTGAASMVGVSGALGVVGIAAGLLL